MKLTLANIKEIKRKSESPLKRRVCNYVIDRWSEYSDKSGIFTDVLYHGCQSGIVGELIYYTDTVRFYKQYRSEINELLYDTMNGTGLYAPSDLFGEKWDKEDPLVYAKHTPRCQIVFLLFQSSKTIFCNLLFARINSCIFVEKRV